MIATLVFLVGVALVSAGAALVYMPAGLVAAGVMLMAGSWLYVRGGR